MPVRVWSRFARPFLARYRLGSSPRDPIGRAIPPELCQLYPKTLTLAMPLNHLNPELRLAIRARWGALVLRLLFFITKHAEVVGGLFLLQRWPGLRDALTNMLPHATRRLGLHSVLAAQEAKSQGWPQEPES